MANYKTFAENRHANFPMGIITDRIVELLSALPAHRVAEAVSEGIIVDGETAGDAFSGYLTAYNLMWDKLDDYAALCNVPVSYFLYGNEMPETYYSYYDKEIIALLNTIPANLLSAALEVVNATYCNPRFRISLSNTPSEKLVAVILQGGKIPRKVPPEEMWCYTTDINYEIYRFRQIRLKERTVFHIDYILDLCTFCHVSPHWVFSLRNTLFCSTPEADKFYDYFCLLSRHQQAVIMGMLLLLCPDPDNLLQADMLARIRQVVAEEGGYVKCL